MRGSFPELVATLDDAIPHTAGKLRVCIATPDIAGPTRSAGIGTAYRNLALALVRAGHNVTILYTRGRYSEIGVIEDWIFQYERAGIVFVPVPAPIPASPRAPGPCQRAYATYEWLRQQRFDLVHLPEWGGGGYYALLAKRLGIDFQETSFCVGVHSPTSWTAAGNAIRVLDLDPLLLDFMERRCVEWADWVISPSQYMLDWMRVAGWQLPQGRCFVHPNVSDLLESQLGRESVDVQTQITEFVFFGRLEWRKGLHIFCDALRQLSNRAVGDVRVTFLGKALGGEFRSQDYVSKELKGIRFPWRVIAELDSEAARDFLRHGHRLAIMPSLVDNSPMGVLECLDAGIPFLACNVGGIREMIDERDWGRVLCPPLSWALTDLLEKTLKCGLAPARHAITPAVNHRTWMTWHSLLANDLDVSISTPAPVDERVAIEPRPTVTVCVIHHNRGWALRQAIDSLCAQTYKTFDVVVVDDGSTDPRTLDDLDQMQKGFAEKQWKLIRQPNLYAGAARNAAARNATGEYLLFMDDDNVAKPDEIEQFITIAQHTRADILTCFGDAFSGNGAPAPGAPASRRMLYLGDCVQSGLFYNLFGDANFFVRRSRFHLLGGFAEDYGVGLEDQEFFARAVLKGASLYVVPAALYWYREDSGHGIKTRHYRRESADWRVLQTYLDSVPSHLHSVLALAQGLFLSRSRGLAGLSFSQTRNAGHQKDWDLLLHLMREEAVNGDGMGDVSAAIKKHGRFWRLGVSAFHWQVRTFLHMARLELRLVRSLRSVVGLVFPKEDH